MKPARPTHIYALTILALIAGIFVLDRVLSADVSISVLYIIPIMLTVRLSGATLQDWQAPAVATFICLAATAINYLVMTSRGYSESLFHDEIVSVAAQLTTALLAILHVRAKRRERATYKRAEAERRRLEAVHSVAAATSSTLDLDLALRGVVDSMVALLNAHTVSIWLADESERELRPALYKSISDQFYQITDRYAQIEWKSSHHPMARAVRERALVIIGEGYDTPPESAENLRTIGAKMAVFVPLFAHDKLVGAMVIAMSDARRLSESDNALIETVAKQVATALENARLFSRLSQQRERLALINEIGQVFASTLDLQTICVAVQKRLSEIIDCDTLLISLYDADTETIRCAFAYTDGEVFPVEKFEPIKLGVGPQSECIRTARPVIVDNIKKRQMTRRRYIGHSEQNPISVLYVPMIAEDRVIGVIQAQSVREGAYTQEDVPLLSIIANQAAIAIPNARLYSEAVEGRREMERANRMKDEFLAILSHELRTPLTPILGGARVLKDLPPDELELKAQAIEVIERNALFQTKLVNDLLDMSRIESGKLSLYVEPTDLNAAVAAALESLKPEAQERSIEIETRLSPTPPVVSADPGRLEQIIRNLVTNAIKFTDSGGSVIVTTERAGDWGLLSVADTGAGIAPDFLPHIFEKFRQADSSTNRRHGGLGLGLSIVKSLVELHGGEIAAHSEGEGRGASFTVRLALAQAAARAPAAAREPDASARDRSPESGMPLSGLRVLIVEDNLDTLEMMRVLCEAEGMRVIEAMTVEQGLALAASEEPHLIISDISLAVVDGYELARRIRDDARLSSLPLIAITGMVSNEDRARALGAGFNAYLPKPIEYNELFNLMRELVETRVVTGN